MRSREFVAMVARLERLISALEEGELALRELADEPIYGPLANARARTAVARQEQLAREEVAHANANVR